MTQPVEPEYAAPPQVLFELAHRTWQAGDATLTVPGLPEGLGPVIVETRIDPTDQPPGQPGGLAKGNAVLVEPGIYQLAAGEPQ
jgi:hypothetical protein